MIRSILNFEAVGHTEGLDPETGQPKYVVSLMVNGHPIGHWTVSAQIGIEMSQNKAILDAFVSGKLWGLLHAAKP